MSGKYIRTVLPDGKSARAFPSGWFSNGKPSGPIFPANRWIFHIGHQRNGEAVFCTVSADLIRNGFDLGGSVPHSPTLTGSPDYSRVIHTVSESYTVRCSQSIICAQTEHGLSLIVFRIGDLPKEDQTRGGKIIEENQIGILRLKRLQAFGLFLTAQYKRNLEHRLARALGRAELAVGHGKQALEFPVQLPSFPGDQHGDQILPCPKTCLFAFQRIGGPDLVKHRRDRVQCLWGHKAAEDLFLSRKDIASGTVDSPIPGNGLNRLGNKTGGPPSTQKHLISLSLEQFYSSAQGRGGV